MWQLMRQHHYLLAAMCVVALLGLTACAGGGPTATVVPTPNQSIVVATGQKVAAVYGEQHPTLVSASGDISESDHQPIDLVVLQGVFHNGTLTATHLSFSMLANGAKVWAVHASDDQNNTIWTAPELAV